MSTPAIVLMTDPSRCNLGDVQYLVQALLEMQKMGEYAAPQAFCDHPAAAGDFIDAYADAYPRLVVEDRAIPSPDDLQSLVTSGRIGALERPPELSPAGVLERPPEQNASGGFPIVVLTLGSSQVLLDALQQAPTMRESVRLIDIVPDNDPAPVAIADAVAVRGLDGEAWEHADSAAPPLELDQIEGPSSTDSTALALHDDQMNLDVVETAAAPHATLPMPDQDAEPAPVADAAAPATPAAPAAPPAPVVTLEPSLPDSASAVASAEPAPEAQSPTATAWPSDPVPVEPSAPSPEPEAQAPDETVDPGDDEPEQPSAEAPGEDGGGPEGHGGGDGKPGDKGHGVGDHADGRSDAGDDGELAANGHASPHAARTASDDHDVSYPPVGSLLASADVLYPARDGGEAHGALRELAAVLLDDGIIDHGLLDADRASDAPPAHQDQGLPVFAHQEPILTVHGGNEVIDDFHGGFDQDGHDALVDSASTLPPHDADL